MNWICLNKKENKPQVLCFHYAGANANIFKSWTDELGEDFEIWVYELPGRFFSAKKLSPFNTLDEAADDAAKGALNFIKDDAIIFGHSLGSYIGFEMIHKFDVTRQESIQCFIPGARRAPHWPKATSSKLPCNVSDLADNDLIELLRTFEGTPDVLLNDAAMMKLCLPVMKSDFALLDHYKFLHQEKIPCSMIALGGINDQNDVPKDHLKAWSELTTGPFKHYLLPGGHFFIQSAQQQVFDVIRYGQPYSFELG